MNVIHNTFATNRFNGSMNMIYQYYDTNVDTNILLKAIWWLLSP